MRIITETCQFDDKMKLKIVRDNFSLHLLTLQVCLFCMVQAQDRDFNSHYWLL